MKRIQAVLVATLIGISGAAVAHGDQHGTRHEAMQKEQKPWGIGGDAKSVTRTVVIQMADNMRFSPDVIEVKQSETIRFVVQNTGNMLHEMVIGTRKELDEHAALMAKFPNMEHDEPYMAHVAPGKSAELVWTFNRPGEFDFACLIAGHYQAGMTGKIKVQAAVAGAKRGG